MKVKDFGGRGSGHFGSLSCVWENAPAALPHEVLQSEFYVPGSSQRRDHYQGSKMLAEMMVLTPETVLLYFNRATGDFVRKASKEATRNAKDMGLKNHPAHGVQGKVFCI